MGPRKARKLRLQHKRWLDLFLVGPFLSDWLFQMTTKDFGYALICHYLLIPRNMKHAEFI
jgi:hypothetical protein